MNDNGEDEGFLALLKPIQDLTRNWEVDLSLHLEEYITYIRQICGDNIPDMNFAQAAVLLQNSANIYSKKVDFLFTTVLQLLDTLSKKHRLISGGGSNLDSPQKGRRSEAKKKAMEEGGDGEGAASGPGRGRRKAAAVLDTEEFAPLDYIISDRSLTLDFEKEKQKQADVKKPKIVLNAAIKVKAKAKTSNNIYNHKEEVMGKKEEFRLNWRICSAGTLHQEFVISKNRFRSLEPVEISIAAPQESYHDSAANADDWQGDDEGYGGEQGEVEGGEVQPPSPPALATSIRSDAIGVDRESEVKPLPEQKREKRIPEIIVEAKDIEWQENDFSNNITEKIIKKRKIAKIPDQVAEDKKRKHDNGLITTFSILDVLFVNFKNTSFNRALDFSYESKNANNYRRQLLLQHRKKYEAYLVNEARKDQIEDFKGFYNADEDSDNENDFEGFGDVNDADDAPEVEVPLPDKEDVINGSAVGGGWRGDDPSSYDNEAMRTMQAYRSRKIDHNRMTDMARRVEEWHQKILPKLECAEQRSGFDVHEYGSKILNNFGGKIGTVKSFEEVVAGNSREEVARYFLSTLMLANQYNVEISETEPGDLNTDCMQLKLLSTVRHHEELDDNLRHTSEKS